MNTQDLGVRLKVRLWNRVPIRLGLGVLLITWAALGLAFLLFNSRQEQLFTEQHVLAAKKESLVIASNLARQMLAGGGWDVWNAISAEAVQYRDLTDAGNIRVVTGDGVVKAASDSAAVGSRMAVKNNPDCPHCDSARPEDFPAVATISGAEGKWLRVVNAVPLAQDCVRCHDAKNPPRSFVSIDYDLAPLERQAAQRREDLLLTALIAGFLVMALTALLFRLLVMRSVDAIARSANRLASGGLAARANVLGKNELSLLAHDFNHMAERIQQQVARIAAAHTESDLLYTLVVEASKNLETSEVAAGVARVLREKLRPKQVALFLESGESSWTCSTCSANTDEKTVSGDGVLQEAVDSGTGQWRAALAAIPQSMVTQACRTQKLQLVKSADGQSFVLPVIADTRLVGLLACVGIPAEIVLSEDLLQNLGVHLTLAAINSRNYTGAITDGLTRLKNKRYGLSRLDETVYAARRYGLPLGLLMCDIDHFKQVNDTYGHPAGDAVLREVSRRIAACVRKADIAVRYGGEEFMLILPETDVNLLAVVGQKIRQAVAAAPVDLGSIGVSLPLTISVGVAALHPGSDSGETLIARADAALYRAKAGGRDRVELER